MQFKFLTIAALATLVAATPPEVCQCNTGPIQCCNSVQSANHGIVPSLLILLSIVLGDVTAQVGLTCNPITIIGGGGNFCTSQPVCCQNNSFNGIIAIGCTLIKINL
ncbi:hypothetical protein D9758_018016 [Tetrapyrgos nigripes]|uniref:Hydrophobin n=1 Tax=Tetrapyrgos nigripes TaxID=182062 RepID=A0A8H5FI57_9AGAR|nr:hypothetical protein D9758_018016 [Tetrapyrgos nigripes]